jgi:hypothetical protein
MASIFIIVINKTGIFFQVLFLKLLDSPQLLQSTTSSALNKCVNNVINKSQTTRYFASPSTRLQSYCLGKFILVCAAAPADVPA